MTNVQNNVKYKAHVTKNIVMTKNPKTMDFCKTPTQNKKPRTSMDPTTPTRSSGNIDLLMDCKVGLYGRCRRAVNCQIDRCPSSQETGQLYIPKVGRWPDGGCPRSDLQRGSDFACWIKGVPILFI